MVLCTGTGSVDAVFNLGNWKTIGVDWDFPWVHDPHADHPPTDLLLDITAFSAKLLHFGVFIKTSNINDETRDSMLTSDSLIRSSYSW